MEMEGTGGGVGAGTTKGRGGGKCKGRTGFKIKSVISGRILVGPHAMLSGATPAQSAQYLLK